MSQRIDVRIGSELVKVLDFYLKNYNLNRTVYIKELILKDLILRATDKELKANLIEQRRENELSVIRYKNKRLFRNLYHNGNYIKRILHLAQTGMFFGNINTEAIKKILVCEKKEYDCFDDETKKDSKVEHDIIQSFSDTKKLTAYMRRQKLIY